AFCENKSARKQDKKGETNKSFCLSQLSCPVPWRFYFCIAVSSETLRSILAENERLTMHTSLLKKKENLGDWTHTLCL
ncbi:unnamed protein product, partial [Ixodes pacificus]